MARCGKVNICMSVQVRLGRPCFQLMQFRLHACLSEARAMLGWIDRYVDGEYLLSSLLPMPRNFHG